MVDCLIVAVILFTATSRSFVMHLYNLASVYPNVRAKLDPLESVIEIIARISAPIAFSHG